MYPRFRPNLSRKELSLIIKNNSGAINVFEKEFANKFEAVDAVAFPYGRSAQWAFFKSLNITNSEIIMPAYTCSVVAHAVTLSKNTPVFIDINLNDYNMKLNDIYKVVTEKTKVIIATHTFGYPQNTDLINEIRDAVERKYGHKVWVMQDCCHCFGAKWNNKYVGNEGDVGVYAFNTSKILTCVFGGILTFTNIELANKVRAWRDENFKSPSIIKNIKRRLYLLLVYLLFKDQTYDTIWFLKNKTNILKHLTDKYHLDNNIHFPPDHLDTMLDFEAAVGIEQLKKYQDIIKIRRSNAKWYSNALKDKLHWVLPPLSEGATYSHYTIRVPNRDEIIDQYAKQGIEIGNIIQYSIPELPKYSNNKQQFPNSKHASQTSINLQMYRSINDKERTIF